MSSTSETLRSAPPPAARARGSVRRAGRALLFAVLTCCLTVLTAGAAPVVAGAAGSALPVANWDALTASGSTLSMWGWAFRP